MSLSQSILTMCFCMLIVFIVLIALLGVIKLTYYVVREIEQKGRHGRRHNTPPGEFFG